VDDHREAIMTTAAAPAVVLLSGGMDSSTLLAYVVRTLGYAPVYALSFRYGQRHDRELACASWQAQAWGVEEHRILAMDFLGDLLREGSALLREGTDVPDLAALSPEELRQPPTYVPNRNMILLSLASAYAEARSVADVFYGAQAQDEYGYWDCTGEFLQRINATLALNRRTPVSVHAPFVAMKKAELLRIGLELGVDYSHTWTCYRGGATPCTTCPTCVERLKAFEAAGVRDPLL